MLVVNRFRDESAHSAANGGGALQADLFAVRALLAGQPGYREGTLGRSLDDPSLWVLTTRWESVGAYRRALSSYEVKLHGVPVLSRAVDEPSAYEVVEPDTVLNVASARVT
ncbi:antibiotic biosynthesis monooxygenase [Nocardioides sp.]|uniref:antibiotic biosynthesis monooxygenase family protein n=1 Tax=Nocardioides sp. TaxID=35761 RepID=UPI0035156F6C